MEKQKPRQRLSRKQYCFLNNIFIAHQPVYVVLQDLNIRPSTLSRWLTKPFFLEKLRMHINHFYLQARLELARSAPAAVSGLSFLSEKSFRHKEIRQACNDLLHFHAKLSPCQGPVPRVKQAKNGAVLDNFGIFSEQFGAVSDNNGDAPDKLNNTNTPKNLTRTPKNNDSQHNL